MNIHAGFSTDTVVQWSEHVSPHAGEILWKNQALMDYDFGVGFSLPMTNPRYWLA